MITLIVAMYCYRKQKILSLPISFCNYFLLQQVDMIDILASSGTKVDMSSEAAVNSRYVYICL